MNSFINFHSFFSFFEFLGAGNCLMVLTTLDGEWFLDDMCLMTEVSIKLASYILSPTLLESNPGIHLVTKCLDLLHGIYKRLQVLLMSILLWCKFVG